MLDRHILAMTKPMIDRIGQALSRRGVTADQVSLAGFGFGLLAVLLIIAGEVHWALIPLLVNRLFDGIDGALARQDSPTNRGAFLDITLDFLFYAGIPLAFAICDPVRNALPAATLLAAFIGTGVTFLAYAIMAEKRGEKSAVYPSKSFYYLGGLTEGFETVTCFVAMCVWPQHFPLIAYVYAALCTVTTITRMVAGWHSFGQPNP